MNVAFRVDASTDIGTGHVARCVALAEAMRAAGADVTFLSRPLPEGVASMLRQRALPVSRIDDCVPGSEEDALKTRQALSRLADERPVDWLIVDHYCIAAPWEISVRPSVRQIMVIDDLADRSHDCDLLLDQNFYYDGEQRYAGLVPERCTTALGPAFALLREEFYEAMRAPRERDGALRRIFVSFGGVDLTNETAKTLEALSQPAFSALEIDVAIGGENQHAASLQRRFGSDPRIRLHDNPSSLAALMASADLALGAGGTMNWERCSLGLPTIVVVVAANQTETCQSLAQAGAIIHLGWHAEVSAAQIAATVEALVADPSAVRRLSRQALQVMAPGSKPAARIKIIDTLMGTNSERRHSTG